MPKRFTLKEAKIRSLEKGFKFLDNFYINKKYKHTFKCLIDNQVHKSTLAHISKNHGLKCCRGRKIGKSQMGKNNPNWNFNLTAKDRRNADRKLYRSDYIKWRKLVKIKDNFMCQICGSKDNIHAHHIESWATNKELRFEINNGVCLDEVCHKRFHSIYGKTNNTRIQFNDFKRSFTNGI